MCDVMTNPLAPATRRLNKRQLPLVGLVFVLALGSAGCGNDDVWIYFDNGGRESMIVKVDGKEDVTIPPGKFVKVECPPGQKRIQVTASGETLYSGVKDLQKSDKMGVGRRYFFNPDNSHRYAVCTIRYGKSPFKGIVEAHLENASGNRRSAVQTAYDELTRDIKLMPSSPWFEVPQGAYVLTKAPEVVRTKGFSATRTVLTRVGSRDHAFLERALDKKNPSESDLEALSDVFESVLDSCLQ